MDFNPMEAKKLRLSSHYTVVLNSFVDIYDKKRNYIEVYNQFGKELNYDAKDKKLVLRKFKEAMENGKESVPMVWG